MKQKGVFCQPGPALLFFLFRFEYLILGAEKLWTLDKLAHGRLYKASRRNLPEK